MNKAWPRITVITPSLNQNGFFLKFISKAVREMVYELVSLVYGRQWTRKSEWSFFA